MPTICGKIAKKVGSNLDVDQDPVCQTDDNSTTVDFTAHVDKSEFFFFTASVKSELQLFAKSVEAAIGGNFTFPTDNCAIDA